MGKYTTFYKAKDGGTPHTKQALNLLRVNI